MSRTEQASIHTGWLSSVKLSIALVISALYNGLRSRAQKLSIGNVWNALALQIMWTFQYALGGTEDLYLVWEEEDQIHLRVEEEPELRSYHTTIGLLPNSGRNSSVKAMMKKNSMAFEEKQTNKLNGSFSEPPS